jgi:uncharacterized membrane protein
MNIMERLLIFGLIAMLMLSPAYAEDYYADVQVRVMATGEVMISGATNHPSLAPGLTQNFTGKSGQNWLLNLTLAENFSEYIYDISFPPNTEINYMNVPKNVRVETEGEIIHIIATGTNQTFFAVVQYSFDGPAMGQPPLDPILMLGIAIIIGFLISQVYFHYKRRRSSKGSTVVPKPKRSYHPEAMTERQNQILDILKREGGHATQAKIQNETKIPKASLSRNIDSLVRKKVIKKERKGMTMVIYFNDE